MLRWVASFLILLTLPLAALTAPLDELLPLVPDDTGVCLVVANLREHHDRLLAAPWFKKLAESDLGKALVSSPEAGKLLKMNEELRQHLEVDWRQLRDEILGDALILAHRQGPAGKADQDRGLLLLRARNPELLARLIDRINQMQRRHGELKALEPRLHRGVRYHLRQEENQERFYLVRGNLFAFATTEDLLRGVIGRLLTPSDKRQTGPVERCLKKLNCEQSLATLWLNPRALDGELAQAGRQNNGPDAQVLKTFARCWAALDGVALGAVVGTDVELWLTLQGRRNDLPAGVRRLAQVAGGASELWQRFPADAILTCAGRLDAQALFQAVGEFQSEPTRQKMRAVLQRLGAGLGLDFFDEVLPQLGPDWGLCLARAADPRHFPHLLLAVRIQAGPAQQPPLDQSLFRTLHVFAGLAIYDYNSKHKQNLRLRTALQGNVEVKYIEGDSVFPAGFQPACALKDGYLLLASSPAAIQRFARRETALPEGVLLRLSYRELAALVKDHRNWLAGAVAAQSPLPEKAIGSWIDNLVWGLGLFERLELHQRLTPGQAVWSLRLFYKE